MILNQNYYPSILVRNQEHSNYCILLLIQIQHYQLSYFHSLRFNATPREMKLIMTLVDMGNPPKENLQERSMMSTNTSETRMVRLDPQGKQNRYLCAKANKKGSKGYEMVVIYMEGTLSSLEKMKEFLK